LKIYYQLLNEKKLSNKEVDKMLLDKANELRDKQMAKRNLEIGSENQTSTI